MKQFNLRKAEAKDLARLIWIDNESCGLYEEVGIKIELSDTHPFVVAEFQRWADAIDKGLAYTAVNENDSSVGFATFGMVDEQPYLDQLSVHLDYMRQGIGTRLLSLAIAWSKDRPLWLTTYSNVPWNRPFYEKHGFNTVAEQLCGPELLDILQDQRSVLPAPDKRIAMVRYATR